MSHGTEHWLIVGGGISGLAAARLLASKGARVRLSEKNVLAPERRSLFESAGVEIRDGGQSESHLDAIDHILVSPGVPQTIPLLVKARELALPIVTEIDLALSHYRGSLVGVTGTNGKSTTVMMTEHLLRQGGRDFVAAGNIGDPPSGVVLDGRARDGMVLELSSYQLELSESIVADAALFTSFSFDHIERHGSLAGYFQAKWRLIAAVRPGGAVIMPDTVYDQARAFGVTMPRQCRLYVVTSAPPAQRGMIEIAAHDVRDHVVGPAEPMTLDFSASALREHHNRLNASYALLACGHLENAAPAALLPRMAGFRGLPYRFETVASWRGHPIINDSKATNVESTVVALQSDYPQVILMLGGQGKGESYLPLAQYADKIRRLICFGASGKTIAAELADHVETEVFPTLAAAMVALPAIFRASPAPVLFSPACASFDEFKNFEHRGQFFTDQAQKISREL